MPGTETINREQLEKKLSETLPDNGDQRNGYALVNVLGRQAFEREHIPHSISIPLGEIERCEKRFDRDKEIVVYCASYDCEAAPKAALKLEKAGFRKILDYEGGMKDWKEAGNEVVVSEQASI